MSRLAAPLILASGSPRRREILATLGLSFEVRPTGVDEERRAGEPPSDMAVRVAREKAELGARGIVEERGGGPPPFVLGADTVVIVDGEPLGKPADDAEAAAMLRALSGRWHRVATAVVLARAGTGFLGARLVVSDVLFRGLGEARVAGYVASGEGRDKAGGYAVQGLGAGLVREVRGSYHNVVGLPAVETLELLEAHGALEAWP